VVFVKQIFCSPRSSLFFIYDFASKRDATETFTQQRFVSVFPSEQTKKNENKGRGGKKKCSCNWRVEKMRITKGRKRFAMRESTRQTFFFLTRISLAHFQFGSSEFMQTEISLLLLTLRLFFYFPFTIFVGAAFSFDSGFQT
jgi:hypothetical protein